MLNKYICFLILVSHFLFFSTSFSASVEEATCERSILDVYIKHRESLLASDFKISNALKLLRHNYIDNVKKEEVFDHFMSLRKAEANIIKINEYSGKCNGDGSAILKLKIINYNSKYDRRVVWFVKSNDGYLIKGSSDEESEYVDEGVEFKVVSF